MHVAEIWRYPVKSMAGERLEQTELTPFGVPGDRIIQVWGANDRVVSARRHPELLGFRATLSESGTPLVNGRPWHSPDLLAAIRRFAGPRAQLLCDEDPEARFDVLPLLVATDGAITAFGYDGRRLRPNIVIGGVDGLGERTWPGSELHIGDAVIRIDSLRSRCVMTTFDPETLEQDPRVLKRIVREFGGELALNCAVAQSGSIAVGQKVRLVRNTNRLSHTVMAGI